MTPRHHLDPATVLGHAAAALAPEAAAIVAIHLEGCAHCRAAVARAEQVGGLLLEHQHVQAAPDARRERLRADMLQRLEHDPPAVPPQPWQDATDRDPDRLPAPLHPYFGTSYSGLRWRWMGPGRHYIRARGPSGGTLLMLRIAPGKRMPVHGHGGGEITQILRGAYQDSLGCFAAGDVADLDADTQHQPVILPGAPCICVAALDAPLRFPGRLARAVQPVFGI
jgi:putative transcriptional regulator